MKNTFAHTVRAFSLITATACLAACETQNCADRPVEEGMPATLTLSISSSAVKSTHTPQDTEDNTVNTVDVFIFNNNGTSTSGDGQLDTYRHFGNGEMQMEIQTTTGQKKICVVVNAKNLDAGNITTLTQFQEAATLLADETFGYLTMYGEEDVTMTAQTSKSITVSRFISRIAVTSVRTDFEGTPYEGIPLTNCRLYMINVHGDKLLHNGNATASPIILNEGQLNETDAASTAQEGLIMDVIETDISHEGYNTPHYLYSYSNETSDIAASTKLILQADLNGTTYYYPIPVNQEGYGHNSEYGEGHYGIRRNTVYSYGITVTRPGALNPDTPVEPGTLDLSIDVEDWLVIPEFNKEF